jgi:hypothetical protein
MPQLVKRKEDNWWVIASALVLVGLWMILPMTADTGADTAPGAEQWRERSLSSLNTISNPTDGKAGSADIKEGRKRQTTSLYQRPESETNALAPENAGSDAAAHDDPADLLAALARIRNGGRRAPTDRLSPSRSKATFSRRGAKNPKKGKLGPAPSSKIGNRGSSGASYALVQKPFGTGGDPGRTSSAKGSYPGASASNIERSRRSATTGSRLDSLSKTKRGTHPSLMGKNESLVASGRRTFDGAGRHRSADTFESLQDAAAPGLLHDGQSPVNLKDNDSNFLDAKSIKLPKLRNYREERLKRMERQLEERKQMTQFILHLLMGGVSAGFSRALGSTAGPSIGYPTIGYGAGSLTGSGVSNSGLNAGPVAGSGYAGY